MKHLHYLLATLVLLMVISGFQVLAGANPGLDQKSHFEEFNNATLSKDWYWENEDPSHWSLAKNPGFITINSQVGDLWGDLNNARNVLLRDTPFGNGDFEVYTKVQFKPTQNWQQLGLLIYQDRDNYVVLKALYDGRDKLQFGKELKGYFASTFMNVDLPKEYYLKLARVGNVYTAYFQGDDQKWTEAGKFEDIFLNKAKIGFLVCNGGSSDAQGMDAGIDWIDLKGDANAAGSVLPDARQLEYNAAPADNPLKGFMPYRDPNDDGYYTKDGQNSSRLNYDQFPHSMEWFYLPLNAIMTGYNEYDWTILEKNLTDIASRGDQAVFRIYLDYPAKASGIPKFLVNDGLKVQKYEDYGGGLAPDYTNKKLFDALENFITAFGKKYDGDPRIGFITAGLIGFWGEWHTFPHEGWMPSVKNLNRVLYAYDKAFSKTKILVRYPIADSPFLHFGYHDDSFAYETLPTNDSNFLSRLNKAFLDVIWKTQPVGGEMRPEIQLSMWNYYPPRGKEDYYTCVAKTHVSWLLDQGVFQEKLPPIKWGRAYEAARQTGYEFFATFAYLDNNLKADAPLRLGVKIKNTGIAPFYYNWTIQVAARDLNNNVIKTWDTPWEITKVLPDSDPIFFEWVQDNPGLKPGTYSLAMKVVNPLKGGKNLYFANVEQEEGGWLNIGTFKINDAQH